MAEKLLDEILAKLKELPAVQMAKLAKETMAATKDLIWCPNPGPQTNAYYCQADELFFGGSAGGGKSDLMIGLALNTHKRSLILRRTNKEASKISQRMIEIVGNKVGYNGQDDVWNRPDGKTIEMGGCQHEDDKQKYKGFRRDLIGFDEVSDFSLSQYLFITTWSGSAHPNQRSRIIAAGNPPTRPEGLWVIKRWAAWIDPNHHRPAQDGELRWYMQMVEGEQAGMEIEVEGPGPHFNGKEMVRATSRSFIRARLSDNPDLAATNYDARLASLPEAMRLAYREGRFDVAIKDDLWQCIPSQWIYDAQRRWTKDAPHMIPMCAIGVDVAQGGADNNVISRRHDWWFDELITVPGVETPLGTEIAGLIVANRRDSAFVVVDMGGGYGGVPFTTLKQNGIDVVAYKGSEGSTKRTEDKQLGFANRRSEAYWKFREALDPSQPGGSPLALPDDPELVADLTAPTYEMSSRGIKVEPKEDVVKRLGRSPDKADAVIMAWSAGPRGYVDMREWSQHQGAGMRGRRPRQQTVALMAPPPKQRQPAVMNKPNAR